MDKRYVVEDASGNILDGEIYHSIEEAKRMAENSVDEYSGVDFVIYELVPVLKAQERKLIWEDVK